MHLSNNPLLSWAFQKTVNQIREKNKLGRYKDILSMKCFRFMQINDCTSCFVELHSHTQDFFYLQGSECSNAQRSKLVPKKIVPSWPNARKLHKKINDNGDEHCVCCFHCELIARKHKTNNCHPLPTLTKKNIETNKKNKKQVNKEIFLTCKEASKCVKFYQC